MGSTLEKIKRLEQYIAADKAAVDSIIERTLDKLLERELASTHKAKARLESQLRAFEQTYGMTSKQFYEKFSSGGLGDKTDFIEWASTVDMLQNAQKRLDALQRDLEV
jgi:hypothetical protein